MHKITLLATHFEKGKNALNILLLSNNATMRALPYLNCLTWLPDCCNRSSLSNNINKRNVTSIFHTVITVCIISWVIDCTNHYFIMLRLFCVCSGVLYKNETYLDKSKPLTNLSIYSLHTVAQSDAELFSLYLADCKGSLSNKDFMIIYLKLLRRRCMGNQLESLTVKNIFYQICLAFHKDIYYWINTRT